MKMPNGYNFIFRNIVQNDNDFIGMVAYTLYKRQKIEWIEAFVRDNQKDPTDQEIEQGFGNFSNMASQQVTYREQAVGIIDKFLDNALSAKVDEAKKQIRDDAIVLAVKKPMWMGVTENLIAGAFATVLTLGAAGIAWVAMQGPEELLKQAIAKTVSSQQPPINKPASKAQQK